MKLNYSHLILFVILTISVTITSCLSEKTITGAVVSAREEASSIGVAIMERGGSAFDAMIATDLALTVCFPNAGNISGGGFMVYRTANGEKGSIDYREKAPSGASVDMYLDNEGNITEKYPFNPNGSENGRCAIISENGRHLAMMPHPERCVLKNQMPWIPEDISNKLNKYTPWILMFRNAYNWCHGS